MRALLVADPPQSHKFKEWLEGEGVDVLDVRSAERASVLRPVPKGTDVVLALRLGQHGAAMKEAARRAGARFLSLPPGKSEAEHVLRENGILGNGAKTIVTIDARPAETLVARAVLDEIARQTTGDLGVAEVGRLTGEVGKERPLYGRAKVVTVKHRGGAESELTPEPTTEPVVEKPPAEPAPVEPVAEVVVAGAVAEAPEPVPEPDVPEPPPEPVKPKRPVPQPVAEALAQAVPHRMIDASTRRAAKRSIAARHAAKMHDLRVILTQRPHLSVERIQDTIRRRYGSGITSTDISRIRQEVQSALSQGLPPRPEQAAGDALLARMQTPEAKQGVVAAFAAPPSPVPSEDPYTRDQRSAFDLMREALKGSTVEELTFRRQPDGSYKVIAKRSVVTVATEEV